ncbi:MAG: DUF4328 domain-containing protein [Archangium sp.]
MNAPEAPAVSMCAVHADRRSVTTCKRCGRFACAACLPNLDELCVECHRRVTMELPPLEGRALAAQVALYAIAGLHAVMGLVNVVQVATDDLAEDSPLAVVYGLTAILYLLVYLATIIVVSMWFHRAAKHALALGAQLEHASTPGGAVGSWFIPFVNLARPFTIARQMMSHAGVDGGIVNTWQATWVLGNIIGNVSSRMEASSGHAGQVTGALSDACLIVAAISAAQVARKLKWNAPGSDARPSLFTPPTAN